MINRTLQAIDVLAMADVIRAAHEGKRVALVSPDGDVSWGTARHLTRGVEDFAFPADSHDVRDVALRVTLESGFERFIPMSDVIADYKDGRFVIDSA